MNRSRPINKAAGVFYWAIFGSGLSRSIWTIIAICLGFCNQAQSQSTIKIAGHVYDDLDGHPIAQALVKISDFGYETLTDQSGFFFFENLPQGSYLLVVSAEGYLDNVAADVAVLADLTSSVSITLKRKLFRMEDRTVSERFRLPVSGDFKVIGREAIDRSGSHSLAEVLNTVEGVYVQENGPGGRTEVSIRGCDPEHVVVLLDGQRINPVASGIADLSTVPLEMVERVELYRGGQSARFGPDAVGGVINIISRTSARSAETEFVNGKYWGKWKTAHYKLTMRDFTPLDNLATKFAYNFNGTAGDFAYNYHYAPRPDLVRTYSGIRLNAFSSHRNYFWSALKKYGQTLSFSTSGQVFEGKNGLPGVVSQPDTTAFKEDKRVLISAQGQYGKGDNYHVELQTGFSRFVHYNNNLDQDRESERYETRGINDIYSIQLNAGKALWAGNQLLAGLDFQRNQLDHADLYRPAMSMGRAIRDNGGVYLNDYQEVKLGWFPFWKTASVDISIRRDHTDTRQLPLSWEEVQSPAKHDYWSHKIGFSMVHDGQLNFIIRGSYGKSYRLPSFNALFWKNDVRSQIRSELKPEKAEHSDFGCEVKLKWWADISAGITYFHSHIKDQIEWRRGYMGIWYPDNLAAARITGHEDFIKIGLFKDRVSIDYQNTVMIAKNFEAGSNVYNKMLTYRPHYTTRLNLMMRIWKFRGSYSIRLVDIRYNLEANTKWYDAYRIDDAKFGFETTVKRITLEAGYRVKNLFDEQYVLIGQYPMPGREWGIEFLLGYKFNM